MAKTPGSLELKEGEPNINCRTKRATSDFMLPT